MPHVGKTIWLITVKKIYGWKINIYSVLSSSETAKYSGRANCNASGWDGLFVNIWSIELIATSKKPERIAARARRIQRLKSFESICKA